MNDSCPGYNMIKRTRTVSDINHIPINVLCISTDLVPPNIVVTEPPEAMGISAHDRAIPPKQQPWKSPLNPVNSDSGDSGYIQNTIIAFKFREQASFLCLE
jgi:hypothetical protein